MWGKSIYLCCMILMLLNLSLYAVLLLHLEVGVSISVFQLKLLTGWPSVIILSASLLFSL